jgi:hypothetical protein
MSEQTTVEAPKAEPAKVSPADAVQKSSPAQDLRDIQMLLVSGIYPGNMAPAVVKGYQVLERMCQEKELAVVPAVEPAPVA